MPSALSVSTSHCPSAGPTNKNSSASIPAYRLDTGIIQDTRNRESYLVAPDLWNTLPDFIKPTRLCLAVTRHRDALDKLLSLMMPAIDFPRALLRGRYMAAVAGMEHNGIPIDVETLAMFRRQWDHIKAELIRSVDAGFGVYDGLTFKQDLFAAYLIRNGIPWPTTSTGRLALDEETFRQQSKAYPQVSALRELRHALSEMRPEKLAIGSDNRNRVKIWPFASRSGRNQPSNNQFINELELAGRRSTAIEAWLGHDARTAKTHYSRVTDIDWELGATERTMTADNDRGQ